MGINIIFYQFDKNGDVDYDINMDEPGLREIIDSIGYDKVKINKEFQEYFDVFSKLKELGYVPENFNIDMIETNEKGELIRVINDYTNNVLDFWTSELSLTTEELYCPLVRQLYDFRKNYDLVKTSKNDNQFFEVGELFNRFNDYFDNNPRILTLNVAEYDFRYLFDNDTYNKFKNVIDEYRFETDFLFVSY